MSGNYTEVSTYPGGGDWPDWARGTWYKGFAHREIPDTGVYKQMLLNSHAEWVHRQTRQCWELGLGMGHAGGSAGRRLFNGVRLS